MVFGTARDIRVYLNPTQVRRYSQGSRYDYFLGVEPIIISMSASPQAMALADLNADGSADLLVGTSSAEANMYFINPGNGRFDLASLVTFGEQSEARSVLVADFNADNVLDILVGNVGDNNVLYLGAHSLLFFVAVGLVCPCGQVLLLCWEY